MGAKRGGGRVLARLIEFMRLVTTLLREQDRAVGAARQRECSFVGVGGRLTSHVRGGLVGGEGDATPSDVGGLCLFSFFLSSCLGEVVNWR